MVWFKTGVVKLLPLPTSVVKLASSYHLAVVPVAQPLAVSVVVIPAQMVLSAAVGAAKIEQIYRAVSSVSACSKLHGCS